MADRYRHIAKTNRISGGRDRGSAGIDRQAAISDRQAAARDRELASLDGLTGVYLRNAGFFEFERELARARRTGQPLTVAFFDVDHLKMINDSEGHAAGDQVLVRVARTLRANMRSYDLIIRYGGDEFVCVISGVSAEAAELRFQAVSDTLNDQGKPGSVTAGIARMRSDDTVNDLVDRADNALYENRRRRRDA